MYSLTQRGKLTDVRTRVHSLWTRHVCVRRRPDVLQATRVNTYRARETHSPGSPCRIERARVDCFEGRRFGHNQTIFSMGTVKPYVRTYVRTYQAWHTPTSRRPMKRFQHACVGGITTPGLRVLRVRAGPVHAAVGHMCPTAALFCDVLRPICLRISKSPRISPPGDLKPQLGCRTRPRSLVREASSRTYAPLHANQCTVASCELTSLETP